MDMNEELGFAGTPGKGGDSDVEDYWCMSPSKELPAWTSNPLPTWSSNPQSPSCEHTSVSLDEDSTRPRKIPFISLIFLIAGFAAIFASRATVTKAAAKAAHLNASRDRMRAALLKTEKDVNEIQREVAAMDMMMNKQLEMDIHSSEVEASRRRALSELNAIQSRLQVNTRQADTLKKQLQDESRKQIIRKYGDGIHRVEIELVFPDGEPGPDSFVIALAPIEFMPHSVETFLDMVSAGLLDGCSFILNALHVVKAAPLPYDGSSAAAKVKAFTDHGLESVAFREYSKYYTHRKYTVGFAADGSPSFYINTEDNSIIHAGDPCFGKVVLGIDTVRRLEASPTRSGIWFKKRIGIKRARILHDTDGR